MRIAMVKFLIVAMGFSIFAAIVAVPSFVATRSSAVESKADEKNVMRSVAEAPLREYVDHQYQFTFQFPADWKFENNLPPGEAGEVRAIISHPVKPMRMMATVGHVGKTVTKQQFESSPNRDAVVEAMIDLTVEQVYKKASREIGAEHMILSEKRMLLSNAGIKFYISTANIKGNVTILIAGIHIVPFKEPYMVSFMMFSPIDRTATMDNEIITLIFNSFHVLGEHPMK